MNCFSSFVGGSENANASSPAINPETTTNASNITILFKQTTNKSNPVFKTL